MSSVLLCGFASTGTAEDLVSVAEVLLGRGHRVTVVAGAPAASCYAHLDVCFVPVPEVELPTARLGVPPFFERIGELFNHVREAFVEPAPEQWQVVQRTLDADRIDVIVTDGLFFGAAFLAYLPRAARPAIIDLGTFPLLAPDAAVPPYGFGISPVPTLTNRLQAFGLEVAAVRSYLRLTKAFSSMVERLTGVRPTGDVRSAGLVADVWAQLTVDRFEYPRTVQPANLRHIGPLRPPSTPRPTWWDPSDDRQVVVMLSDYGADVADLVLPTLTACDGQDVIQIVAGFTRDEVGERSPGPLSELVHFVDAVPWHYLRRDRTVVVSTGNYLHVQHALRFGIPVVVAGTFANQIETAARTAWAGVGIDLRTRRPTSEAVWNAVDRIRRDPGIRHAVARIAARIAASDAEGSLADLVEQCATTDLHPRTVDVVPARQ